MRQTDIPESQQSLSQTARISTRNETTSPTTVDVVCHRAGGCRVLSESRVSLRQVVLACLMVALVFLPAFPVAAAPQQDAGEELLDLPLQADRENKKLPTREELELPSVADLLQKPAVDWIVLQDGHVLIVEPISIRPNAIQILKEKYDESSKWPRGREPEERELQRLRRLRLLYLDVVLPDSDGTPLQLNIDKFVSEILYHEDLMLRRIDQLLKDNRLQEVFEMLLVLDRRHPGWPGYDQRYHRMLLQEARTRFENEQYSDALVSLESIHNENRDYPGLQEELGKVAEQLIQAPFDVGDYRQARFYLSWLSRLEPDHPVAVKWKERLLADSDKLAQRANTAYAEKRYADATALALEAGYVWPANFDVREVHRKAASRYQQLTAGVLQLAPQNGPNYLRLGADQRYRRLTRLPLFQPDRIDDAAHYDSRLLEQWEPTDLGRQMDFTLRQSRGYWESQPLVTTPAIVGRLSAMVDPANSDYDERLASYVSTIRVRSPFEFSVEFERVPVRTEGLFASLFQYDPLLPASASGSIAPADETTGNAGTDDSNASPSPTISVFPFRMDERDEQHAVFRRAFPETDDQKVYHVAEIVEKKYDDYDKCMQALIRGEVLYVPHMQPWDVDPLSQDERFYVREYALPKTHVLQFHPKSGTLRNQELRRSLAYGLDREEILRETVLQDLTAKHGRVVSAPVPRSSYAYNPLSQPRRHDLRLGISLGIAAKKHFGGELPELRMACEPDPIVEAAAAQIVRQWRRIGINVRLLTREESWAALNQPTDEPHWEILYRTVQLSEPVVDLWPFLTLKTHADVRSVTFLPDWLRQELIALEQVGDWQSAVRICHNLHDHLQAEVQLIPLWEVDDFQIMRRTVRDSPDRPVSPYQDIERWTIQPWYPTDTP